MRVRAQAPYIDHNPCVHIHMPRPRDGYKQSGFWSSLTPRNFCVTQLCNNVCFLTGAQHDMYVQCNLLQWGHIVAAELLFLSVHGWDQGCFSATGHCSSAHHGNFCIVWYHQSFAYTTSHKQRVHNARLEPYTAAPAVVYIATNFLFLPCWFSANKGAVLMQDKNILTDLSSSVCPTSGSSWRPTMKAVNEQSLTHFGILRVWLLLVCPTVCCTKIIPCFGLSSSLKTWLKFFPPPCWMIKAVHSPLPVYWCTHTPRSSTCGRSTVYKYSKVLHVMLIQKSNHSYYHFSKNTIQFTTKSHLLYTPVRTAVIYYHI